MNEQEATSEGQRLDWDEVRVHPLPVGGFMLFVKGVAPMPMEVKLIPLPVGIAPEDYQGVEVRGIPGEVTTKVETPWSVEIETKELPHGRRGFVLIGATMREYVPPRED